MHRLISRLAGALGLVLLAAGCHASGIGPSLTDTQQEALGQQIFRNECGGRTACLVHWNPGETFPSLGIGHFIWYPAGVDAPFVESFPALMEHMKARSVSMPSWLESLEPFDAPWPDREAFLAERDGERVRELRRLLERTQGLQAEFIFLRARASLERVVEAAPIAERAAIRRRLEALSATPGGVYALVDYVNFKGEGVSADESYQGEGWGLLQVLRQMSRSDPGSALDRFRQAAAVVLTRRAGNASASIEREQWLSGWLNRLETYREPDAE